MWNLRRSCLKLDMDDFYENYVAICRLKGIDACDAEVVLKKSQETWKYITLFMSNNMSAVENLHERIRKEVEYLISDIVLNWITTRGAEMLDLYNYIGTVEYLRCWMRQMLEKYGSVVSSIQRTRYDSTTLCRTISNINAEITSNVLEVLGLGDVSERGTIESLSETREIVGNVRLDRRRLIDSYVT